MRNLIFSICILTLLTLTGCRGWRSSEPPIHPNPNLDWQAKFPAQRFSQMPPENAIPYGNSTQPTTGRAKYIKSSPAFYYGKTSAGAWISRPPVPVTLDLVKRGQERYNIYCAPCHTQTGNGLKSLIAQHGWMPSNLSSATTVQKKDGELFHIIGNGIRTMPGYSKIISEDDRWAIVSYIRALQRMHSTQYSELPTDIRQQLPKGGVK